MKNLIQSEQYEYICDTCGMNLLNEMFGIPITIDFSYGHILDGNEYHFCTLICAQQFIENELSKEEKH